MRSSTAACILALGVLCAAPAEAVQSCTPQHATPELTLCHEAVVSAPVVEVWRLVSTAEGWRSWAAPVAYLELRPGGLIETSYSPDAEVGAPGNIRNRIISFTPERALAIEIADAPPGFPHEDLARQLVTTIELETVDATHTRVRVVMTGYRDEPGFDQLREFFDRGNAFTLAKLREAIERGPVDWAAERIPEAGEP